MSSQSHCQNQRASPVALTIAGSDSGGGAGIQADLKTFAALGVFGTSAITCVTAQHPDRVAGVAAIDPEMVALQIHTVCQGFPVAAAKTGMLYSSAIVKAAAQAVADLRIPKVVVDPVMVATSGAQLLQPEAVAALCSRLIPLAAVITPNVPEAEVLCGHAIRSTVEQEQAARELSEKFGVACVVKGGHLRIEDCRLKIADCGSKVRRAEEVVDVLCQGGRITVFRAPRIKAVETHGTGCTFSAALTAFLARGEDIVTAVEHAQGFVVAALVHAIQAGKHSPLGIGHWNREGKWTSS
jgi:hydroxymethylpyrimidine kinase/phosphomethylpyrimidine kinase